jgi:hypothetical protein
VVMFRSFDTTHVRVPRSTHVAADQLVQFRTIPGATLIACSQRTRSRRSTRLASSALVTFPQTAPWTLPKGPWHLDYPYWFPSDAIWGMNVFLFVAEVEPRGGGTLVVQSSNRLVEKFVHATPDLGGKWSVLAKRFRTRYPWFVDLSQPAHGAIRESARIAHFMGDDTTIDGVNVRVVELVGDPGDIVLCHPWLVHTWSPNVRSRPRLMRAARVWRRDAKAPASSVDTASASAPGFFRPSRAL